MPSPGPHDRPADRAAAREALPGESDLRDLYRGDYVARFPDRPGRRLERLAPLLELPPAACVVDLACGNGLLLDLLHERIDEYVGVDFSSEFIAAAEERAARRGLTKGRFVCSDIEELLRASPEAFDAAFALDFAEHIDDRDFRRIFRAVRRALRPGAPLYLHTPNLAFVVERLKERGILAQFPEHIAVRDAAQLTALLEACGFRRIDVRFLSHYHPVLRPLHLLSALPGIGRALQARLFVRARA